MKVFTGKMLLVWLLFASALLVCCGVWAQEEVLPAEVAPEAVVAAAEADEEEPPTIIVAPPPPIVADSNILKRAPVIDGTVSEGEWDVFQTFTRGDWQVTAFANWDNENLYMALTSNAPCDVMVLLDANDDGWFHGDDNYELRAIRQADGSYAKQVLRFESRNTVSILPLPVSENESEQVQLETNTVGDAVHFEWKIPAYLVRNLKLTPSRKIGLQIAARQGSDENAWVPEGVGVQTKECIKSELAAKKSTALSPLSLDFFTRDLRVTKGDTVTVTLNLFNPGPETVAIREILIRGNGLSEQYLDVIRKKTENFEPKKRHKEDFKFLIPTSMPLGTWVLGAEVSSDGQRLGAGLASFDVLEPFEVELVLPKDDIPTNARDITLTAAVTNNTRKSLWGKVKIELPVGWTYRKGISVREYAIRTRGGQATISFKAIPPLGAIGDVPVKVTVNSQETTKTAEGTFRLATPSQ